MSHDLDSDPAIVHLYVVRRKLGGLAPRGGSVAHSALLLRTADDFYFLMEYGVEDRAGDKNTVDVHGVSTPSLRTVEAGAATFAYGGYSWDKQTKGAAVGGVPLSFIKAIMDSFRASGAYELRRHNCHMAQEYVRTTLGLHVDSPYVVPK